MFTTSLVCHDTLAVVMLNIILVTQYKPLCNGQLSRQSDTDVAIQVQKLSSDVQNEPYTFSIHFIHDY